MSLSNNGQPAPSASTSDSAELSSSAKSFAGYVDEAKSFPEVRSDLVASFKAQIAGGDYPSSDTLDGLSNALAGLVS